MLIRYFKLKRLQNHFIFIMVFSVIFSFSSCNELKITLLKTIYGIKKPKIETEKSLTKYLKRKKINSNNVYTLDEKDYYQIQKLVSAGIPDIIVYDCKNDKPIKYREDTMCNGYAFGFIERLKKDTTFQYVDTIPNFSDLISMLRDLKGNVANIEKNKNADYYLFIFWARYTGRLNKNHVKVWEKQANNNKQAKIEVIKINIDEQEWWKKK